jgi:undecaprenyl-diphosphatase
MYGFYSAHASNAFSMAVFLAVILWKDYRFLILLTVTWALLMSYTRIYLGVHYPGDIMAGMIAGSIIGFICGKACLRILRH